jgi:hypothetical protein
MDLKGEFLPMKGLRHSRTKEVVSRRRRFANELMEMFLTISGYPYPR